MPTNDFSVKYQKKKKNKKKIVAIVASLKTDYYHVLDEFKSKLSVNLKIKREK